MDVTRIIRGSAVPDVVTLGAQVIGDFTRFSIFCRNGTRLWLLLYDDPEATEPCLEFELDPLRDRVGDIWTIRLEGLGVGWCYLYRIDGPNDPAQGHRFDKRMLLFDPFAKAITGGRFGERSLTPGPSKCVVVDDAYDWEGDRPLNTPIEKTIIYETHTRGFTAHPSSGVEDRGTFRGLAQKIPYLKDLGVTAVELLPIQQFNELEGLRHHPKTGQPLLNYWGYSTAAFFAPNRQYSASSAADGPVTEFKDLVKQLHRAGIEIILDIVFNHTAEGNELGPVISFRGIDNSIYYILGEDKSTYQNFSGCGNTVNCNHPVVHSFILDCLHYWVVYMHVDGFRFDLASILGRDPEGRLLENAPLVEAIAEDPILRQTKIIAEAWDAAGAYQVGSFSRGRWAEWNGRFRDDVRLFWHRQARNPAALATRLTGSSDLYAGSGRRPIHSINFITSHDGFTLADLVSYQKKHNQANGEDNWDGDNHNLSANHGQEGPTKNPEVLARRLRQRKNFLATLLLSQGVPMILGGDECGRTQQGNNNAYCQDNEISWFDWNLVETEAGFRRFCRELIVFRQRHPVLRRRTFFSGETGRIDEEGIGSDVKWFAASDQMLDWNGKARTLGCFLDGRRELTGAAFDDDDLCLLINREQEGKAFDLPGLPDWRLAIDTSRESPDDIFELGREPVLDGRTVKVGFGSLVALIRRRPE